MGKVRKIIPENQSNAVLLRNANRKKKLAALCFQDIVLELMNEWDVEMAEIQKATDIPFTTLWDWIVKGRTPLLDRNILALSQYFGCTINYLAFGIGEEPDPPTKSKNP